MLLSKVAMDIEAKHTKDGIAEWRYQDVPEKLWPIQPLRDFWGINRRTEAKLNKRHIYDWRFSKISISLFETRFCVLGVDMHLHANGIDQSKVREKYKVTNPSICKSQILMRDYQFEESKVVMQELIEDVASRLRAQKISTYNSFFLWLC